MAWIILIASGVFEAVWATALGKSDGLTRAVPVLIFFSALIISMLGLAYAMKTIPTGTAYAVWVGIGATLTVAYGMIAGGDMVSGVKILLLFVLIGSIVCLKFVH